MQNSNNGNSNGSVAGVTPATNQPTAIQPAATQAIDDDDNNTSTTQSPKVNLSTPATPSTPATSATAGALEMWKDVMNSNLQYGIDNGANSENGWEAFKNMFRYEYRQEYKERQDQIQEYKDGNFSDIKEKEKLRESSQDNYAFNNLGRIFNVSNGKAADQLLTGLKARVGDGLGEGQNATSFYKIFTPSNIHILATCLQKAPELYKTYTGKDSKDEKKGVPELYSNEATPQHAAQMGICLFAMCMTAGKVNDIELTKFVERYTKMDATQRADMATLANAEIGRQMMAEYSTRINDLQSGNSPVLNKDGTLCKGDFIDESGKFVKDADQKISIDNIKGFAEQLGIMDSKIKSSGAEAHREMLKAGATYNLYREMWAKTFKDSLEVGGMDPNDAKKLTDYIFIPKEDALKMKNSFMTNLTDADIEMLKSVNSLSKTYGKGEKMEEKDAIEALKQIRMQRMEAFLGKGEITPEMRKELEKLDIQGLDAGLKQPVTTPPVKDYTAEITAFNQAKTKANQGLEEAEKSLGKAEESVKKDDNGLDINDIKIEFTDIESKTLEELQTLQKKNQQDIEEKTNEMEGINIEDINRQIEKAQKQIEEQKKQITEQAKQGDDNVTKLQGTDNDKKDQAKAGLKDNTKALTEAADKLNELNAELQDLQQQADKYNKLQNEIENLQGMQEKIDNKIEEMNMLSIDIDNNLFKDTDYDKKRQEEQAKAEEERKKQEEEERKRQEEEKKLNDAKGASEGAKKDYEQAVGGFNAAKEAKLGKFDEEILKAEKKAEEVSQIELTGAKEPAAEQGNKVPEFTADTNKSTEEKLKAAEEFKAKQEQEFKKNTEALDANRTTLGEQEKALNEKKAEFENQKKELEGKIEQYKQKLSLDKNIADGIKAAEPQGLTEKDATTAEDHNKNAEAYKKATAEVQRQSEEMKQDINKQDFADIEKKIEGLTKLQEEINEKQKEVDGLKQTQQNLEAKGKDLEAVIKDAGEQIDGFKEQKRQDEEAERQRQEEEAEEERQRQEEEKKQQGDLSKAKAGYQEKLTEFERGAAESQNKIQEQEDELSKLKNDVVADVNIAANVDAGNSVDITDVATDDINTLTDENAANAMIQQIDAKQQEVDNALQANENEFKAEELKKTSLDEEVKEKQEALTKLLEEAKQKLEEDKAALQTANGAVDTIEKDVKQGENGADKPAQTTMYNKKAQDVENQTNALPKVDNDFTKIEAAKKELQDAVNKQQQCNVNIDALQSKQNDLDVKNKALSEAKKAANDKKQSIEEEKKPPMTKHDFDDKLKELDKQMEQLTKSAPKFGIMTDLQHKIKIDVEKNEKGKDDKGKKIEIPTDAFNKFDANKIDFEKANCVKDTDAKQIISDDDHKKLGSGKQAAFNNYVLKPMLQAKDKINKYPANAYQHIADMKEAVSKQAKNSESIGKPKQTNHANLSLNTDEVNSISNCFTKGLEKYEENLTKHNQELINLKQKYEALRDAKKEFPMDATELDTKIDTLDNQQKTNSNDLTQLQQGKKKYDGAQKPIQQATTEKENAKPSKSGGKGVVPLKKELQKGFSSVHQASNNINSNVARNDQRQQGVQI